MTRRFVGRGFRAVAMVGALVVSTTSTARAQERQFTKIDEIAAIVGRTPIPRSQIEEGVQLLRSQGAELPTDSAGMYELRRALLDSIIDEELMVQAAIADTFVRVIE